MAKKAKLVLIDAHALIHRAYHALPPMSTRNGKPTNAVYGFTTTLLKVLQTLKPTHVAAAFDMKGPTFRHTVYKDYKAHRKAADNELVVQFDTVREVIRAFNIPVLEKKGFEADDIIGTLVTIVDKGVTKVIVTGDMDAVQLVDQSTSVFTLKRSITDTVLYDEAAVRERYGFAPAHLVDYKGLRGDPSDNIPGVAGIGDKTASELVATYGSIEKIYEHLTDLSPRVQSKLQGHQKDALFSRELATIRRDVPLEFSLDAAVLHDYDGEAVRRLFEELEFRSLMSRLPKSSRSTLQPTLFQGQDLETRNNSSDILPEHYHLVEGKKAQHELQQVLLKQEVIAFDTETERLGARTSPIVGMSFAWRDAAGTLQAYYVPVTQKEVKHWREVLEHARVQKVGHNIKYDLEVLQQSGVMLEGVVFDTMVASYLLKPDGRQHNLDALAVQELGHHCIPITDLIGEGKQQRSMAEVPVLDVARYACEDAEITLRLYEVFSPRIAETGLQRVMTELEMPLIPVLADIELTGVALDTNHLKTLKERVGVRIEQLRQAIWQAAGEEFNVNSTLQLRRILYEKLQLSTDGIKKTKSGYSTAASELAKLRASHEIIKLLEEYREYTKLLSTYIITLPELVDATTNRLHASFNQVVAATGRLSSSDPNLQNIPIRTELGQEIRAAFIAPSGRQLIKADYSQIELRVAAHVSSDEKMMAAFRAGEDIHQSTAAWVYGVALDKVTPQQRRNAKTLNFGVLYGMGAINFARGAGISVEEARSFIERYREQYAGITQYIAETIKQAELLGYTETILGRRRYVPEILSRTPAIRAQAERTAFNFPIQGTGADILKKAMIELHNYLDKHYEKAKLILTVHDELVCEAATADAEELAADMRRIMEGVTTLDVPLVVEVAIGQNWRDMEPVPSAKK